MTLSMHRRRTSRAGALAVLVIAAACGREQPPEPPTPGPAAPAPEPDEPPAPEVRGERIRVCIAEPRGLRLVAAIEEAATGDTVVVRDGRVVPFRDAWVRRDLYLAAADWWQRGEQLQLFGRAYLPTGGNRAIEPDQLEYAADYRGVPVFAAAGSPVPPDAVYLPVTSGCVFQAYVRRR